MYDPLGLSIGTTNLVAVRADHPPVMRRSVLTLFDRRAPEVGAPVENSPGSIVGGFVQRVGDRVPLAASDGSLHDPDILLVGAVDAMVAATGVDATTSQLAIAVPAHWSSAARYALQSALESHAGLSTLGGPAHLVSDAVAALTAVDADFALPRRGLVALMDFGGSGTSITLADAAAGFEPIDQTRRYRQFSGERIDKTLLAHVLGRVESADGADPGQTAASAELARLLRECCAAKERLSERTATEVIVDARRGSIQVTRAELESLVEGRLSGLVSAFQDMLQRNGTGWNQLSAIVTVGGGANIPLIAQKLASRRRVPVLCSRQPAFDIASGAVLLAGRGFGAEAELQTARALAVSVPATVAAPAVRDIPGSTALAEPELAWSQEDFSTSYEPVPYIGPPYDDGGDDDFDLRPRPPLRRASRGRRSRLPGTALGLGAVVAMVALGGVAYTLTGKTRTEAPAPPTVSAVVPIDTNAESPAPEPVAPPPTAVAPQPTAVEPEAPVDPPPPAATTRPPQPTTTTAPPPTTTTPPPTTTSAPATTTTTTTTTTTPPPTTTTTTTPPMRTNYLTIPFVPVPIPVQVPNTGG